MAETLFHTVDHPSWHRRDRPKLRRQQYCYILKWACDVAPSQRSPNVEAWNGLQSFSIAVTPFLGTVPSIIADPPILSSSPENGSATAMLGRSWLAKRSNSSACRVPSLQNAPEGPANAQSAHSFFWDDLIILKKISITHCSGLLYHMRRLRKEEYLKKTENLDSARTWRLESQWRVEDTYSAAVWSCSRPMVGLFYKAVPVLADEDNIGGSALITSADRQASTVRSRPIPVCDRPPRRQIGCHVGRLRSPQRVPSRGERLYTRSRLTHEVATFSTI